jgi:hypothetical protein
VARTAPGTPVDPLAAALGKEDGVGVVAVVRPGPHPDDDPDSDQQKHLLAAPRGIGAIDAWKTAGADGAGVRLLDVERGWTVDHEDLLDHAIGTPLTGRILADSRWHGTAVLGVLASFDNERHGIGIVPNLESIHVASRHEASVADAVVAGADLFCRDGREGDVILLEVQDETGGLYHPVEVDGPTWCAIRLATSLGIVVVEAAGNGRADGSGGISLDDHFPTLDRAHADFRDSLAILVAAGRVKAVKSGKAKTYVWFRLDESNHGSRIDCFGAGAKVWTLSSSVDGATDLFHDDFGMTSAASSIVAGAVAAVQGVRRAAGKTPLPPTSLRGLMAQAENTAPSPKEPLEAQMGMMPDLAFLIAQALTLP